MQQWEKGEAKQKNPPDHIHWQINWDARHTAQLMMAAVNPILLSHQKCRNCHQLTDNLPKWCSLCKRPLLQGMPDHRMEMWPLEATQ